MYDIYNKEKKNMLTETLNSIESFFKHDTIAYYGKIENNLSKHFLNLVQNLSSHEKSFGKEKLCIILFSDGGTINTIDLLHKNIFRWYDSVDFIIPEYAFSCATMFSFMGENILVDKEKSSFGMIDEQVLTNFPHRPDQSVFDVFNLLGVKYEFNNNTDNIDDSILFDISKIMHPYNPSVARDIEGTKRARKLCYDILLSNNLKKTPDNQKIAIRIINDLMDIKKHFGHDTKIMPQYLKEIGLNIDYYSNNEKLNNLIHVYHCTLKNIIGKDNRVFFTDYENGNFLHCIVHSKIGAII